MVSHLNVSKAVAINRLPQDVCFAVDWREGDEQEGDPTFVFRGTNVYWLRQVFDFLVPPNGKGIARSYEADYEHDVAYRVGYGYDRHYVSLHGFDRHFCSVSDACLLIESVFRRMIARNIVCLPLSTFLNV